MISRSIYQVVMTFEQTLAEEFQNWLTPHMADMLNLPTFYQTELLKKDNHQGLCQWWARYYYWEPQDLETYLQQYAQAMRCDLPESFREKIKFSRQQVTEVAL